MAAWPISTPFWPWLPAAPSWFVVERGAEGLSATARAGQTRHSRQQHGALFPRTSSTFPPKGLIGGVEDRDWPRRKAVFGYTRLMVGAFGLGAGWKALRRAILTRIERIQGGAPLATNRATPTNPPVPNAADGPIARPHLHPSGWPSDLTAAKRVCRPKAPSPNTWPTESGNKGRGCHPGSGRLWLHQRVRGRKDQARRAHLPASTKATSEIMEWTIARDRWQQHLKTQGALLNGRRDWKHAMPTQPQNRAQLRRIGDARPGRYSRARPTLTG